jgi:exopolyphosphatase/guanosine-5'-triphosphate,3'-diphosphate pyrophosphatase
MLKSLQSLIDLQQLNGAASRATHKTAIIDAGSNSFRLIVMSYTPHYAYHMTDEVRETVRLVHGLGETGRLLPEGMERGIEVMRMYRAFCNSLGIDDMIAVATSAVREAENKAEFLERVKNEAGITLRLLSGAEEAYYGYLAAVNSTTLTDGFVIDQGGGSLQITRVAGRRNYESVSFTLGAVRVMEEWLPDSPASKEEVTRLRRHVRKTLEVCPWFQAAPGTRLVAEGGSLRNAARIAQKAKFYPLDELHGHQLTRDELHKVIKQLEPLSVDEKRLVPGMKPDRADITLAASIVIEECMRAAGYESLTVSSQGLREGLFLEKFLAGGALPLFQDVRKASVMNIAHLYNYQKHHVYHVAHLALSLFDQLAAKGGVWVRGDERELLWAACILHDIGMNIDYNDHHRHSYYLILNSGLPGFTHRELAMIALATKFHRKGDPDPAELGPLLDRDDEKVLWRMTALLRLAEQLDRSRDGSVRDVRLHIQGDTALLEAVSEGDISVALWSAQPHAAIFQAAYGKTLEIVHVRQ